MERRFMNEQKKYNRWMHKLFNTFNTKKYCCGNENGSCFFGCAFYKVIHSVNNRILCKRIDDAKWTVLCFFAIPPSFKAALCVFSHRLFQPKRFCWRQTTIDRFVDNFLSLFTVINEFVMRHKQMLKTK